MAYNLPIGQYSSTSDNDHTPGTAVADYAVWDWFTGEAQKQAANNAYSLSNMREQNQFNHDESQLQRDYETEMSNTAYQRAAADMKAAGINILNSGASQQASTPSGTAASGSSAAASSSGSRRGVGSALLGITKLLLGVATSNATVAASGASDLIKKKVSDKTEEYMQNKKAYGKYNPTYAERLKSVQDSFKAIGLDF